MNPAFVPPIDPSSIRKRFKLKLLKAEFGDGYTQTTRDWLNHQRLTLDLEWTVLTPDQSAAILAFLEERGGDRPFSYHGKQFTCAVWQEDTTRKDIRSIRATFEQDFNL
jgi:phage-related protein